MFTTVNVISLCCNTEINGCIFAKNKKKSLSFQPVVSFSTWHYYLCRYLLSSSGLSFLQIIIMLLIIIISAITHESSLSFVLLSTIGYHHILYICYIIYYLLSLSVLSSVTCYHYRCCLPSSSDLVTSYLWSSVLLSAISILHITCQRISTPPLQV